MKPKMPSSAVENVSKDVLMSGSYDSCAVGDLERQFENLAMSQQEAKCGSCFDSQELQMISRGLALFNKCLRLEELEESLRCIISKRAYSFLSLYMKKGGKSLFASVISSPQSFVRFLRLVYEMTIDLSSVGLSDHDIITARGPLAKKTSSNHRLHPYEESLENQPRRSSLNQLVTDELLSHSPSSEELDQIMGDFFRSLSEEEKVSLRFIFQSPNLVIEDTELPQDEGIYYNLDDFPSSPLKMPSPTAEVLSVMPPDGCSIEENQVFFQCVPNVENFNMSTSPINFDFASTAGNVSPYLHVEQLSTLEINNTPILPLGTEPAGPVLFPSTARHSPAPLPFDSAREEMLARMNLAERERNVQKLAAYTDAELLYEDEEGDTRLIIACASPRTTLEGLFALTERLTKYPKHFALRNLQGKTAVMFAAIEKKPLVAGYIAETMVSLGVMLNQIDLEGNSVFHLLSQLGDDYAEVLQYLLRVSSADGKSAYDLSAFNYQGRTALHEAVLSNTTTDGGSDQKGSCYKIARLLLTHGADATLRDATSGRTPVHCAIEKQDFVMLELLLVHCPAAANALSYNDNTPLHIAGTLLNVTEEQQLNLVKTLLKHGADKTRRNKAKKLPIEVVPRDKIKIKEVLMARPRQHRST